MPGRRPLLPVLKSLRRKRRPKERLPRRDVKRPRNVPQQRERPLPRGEEKL